jgi:vancomycin permeability regulator SanA
MKGTRRGKTVFSFSDAVVIAQTHEQTKALVIAAMNQVKELL